MSIQLRYNEGKCILYITVENEVNEKLLEAMLTEIVTSKKYPSNVNTLWDIRQLPFQAFTSDLARSLIEIREKFPQRGLAKIAVVVSTDLGFGIVRMHQILSNNLVQKIRVFKDFEAAEQWLLLDFFG